MTSKTFRIGTRVSRMAVQQSEAVQQALQTAFPEHRFELVTRQATADRDHKSRLGALGGKGGAFIQAMRDMMTSGEADMAMHSLKDLPGNEDYYASSSFTIGSCLKRDDARDALVMKTGQVCDSDHPPAVIGTSSIRRRAFLHRLFPTSRIVAFRGSADLRLQRLDEGVPMEFNYGGSTPAVDGLVLAKSGLERIGYGDRVTRPFSVDEMCPAVGQGVVVVEYATDNEEVGRLLSRINDKETTFLYQAERAMLRELNGHCDSPIGGYAWIDGGRLHLKGVVISPDGGSVIEVGDSTLNSAAADLGKRVGVRLNRLGAQIIIGESRFAE